MYNLLIVDDEAIIADYISTVFMNSEVMADILLNVARANTAFEALDIIENTNIDVVLSDVSMPGMNGIELLEKVRQRRPCIKVVLMSGYDDFEYVQAAMRNSVIDYVLKTEGEEQLILSVKNAISALEEDMRNEELIRKMSLSLKLANSVLIERILADILDGQQFSESYLASHFSDIDSPLNAMQPVFVILGKANSQDMAAITHNDLYKAKALIEEYFKENMNCASVVYEGRLVWLLQVNKQNSEGDQEFAQLSDRLDNLQKMCVDMFNINISFAVAEKCVKWENLMDVFRYLDSALDEQPSGDGGIILINESNFEKSFEYYDTVNKVRSAIKMMNRLPSCLLDGNSSEFFNLYFNIMSVLKILPQNYESIKQEAIFTLTVQFLYVRNRMGDDYEHISIKDLSEKQNWVDIENYFKDIAVKIFEQREKNNCANTCKIFDTINKYASEHLDEDLHLNRFAEMLHYHPFYLSRLFKQVAGTTFSDYIAKIKMDKAKEMLSDTDIKISNIALTLGFNNTSYFTRFFKKHTGLAPLDYRIDSHTNK